MIAPLARVLGVDGDSHGALVGLFRTLYRRSGTNVLRKGSEARPTSLVWVWVVYGIYGGIASMTAFLPFARFAFGSIVCGSALVLLGLAIVADFAILVVAPGDDDVLFHLPLDSRTYLSARLSFAARHVAGIAFAYGFFPALAGALRYGQPLWGPLFLASVVAVGWFALVLAFAVYRLALRLLGGERLRTLVAYLPGLVSVLLYLGPQMIPRSALSTRWDPLGDLAWLAPPAWFAAVPEAVLTGAGPSGIDPTVLLCAVLGIVVLPLSAAVLVRALARGFLDDLRRLLAGSSERRGAVEARRARALPPAPLVARLFGVASPEARAGYLLHRAASRSREARARTLPMLAMPVVFCIVSLVSLRGAGPGFAAPYLVGATAGTLWALTAYHETPDAAWILAATPYRRYGEVVRGMVASILVRQVLPLAVIVVGLRAMADPSPEAVLASVHGILGSLLGLPLLVGHMRHVPFALAYRSREGGKGILPALLNLLVAGLAGVVQAVLTAFVPWGFAVTIPLFAAILAVWLWGVARDLDAYPPEELHPLGAS